MNHPEPANRLRQMILRALKGEQIISPLATDVYLWHLR